MRHACRVRRLAVILTCTFLVGGCATRPDSLESRLVRASDLPGQWRSFDARGGGGGSFCGEITPSSPEPRRSASTAFAVDPDDGPIFGERLEVYEQGEATDVLEASRDLELPCEWTEDGGARWRMTRETPPTVGDGGRVFLITSLDRPDSFNYEVATRSGDELLLVVVNQRTADRALVDQLVEITWRAMQV